MNKNTLFDYDWKMLTWIVKWFKRIYNMQLETEHYKEKNEKIKVFLNKNLIDEKVNNYAYKEKNNWFLWLNYTKNNNDILNWIIIKIEKKDYKKYAERESKYYLLKIEYQEIHPSNWLKTWKKWDVFINLTKEEYLNNNDKIYPNKFYHKNTRNWAYEFWKYFWKMFDETTYLNNWKLVKII